MGSLEVNVSSALKRNNGKVDCCTIILTAESNLR